MDRPLFLGFDVAMPGPETIEPAALATEGVARHNKGRMSMRPFWNLGIALIALIAIGLSVFNLERGRSGLEISPLSIGTTPATFYRKPGSSGPLVVVAHGFAGSRQLMQAYSLRAQPKIKLSDFSDL